MNITAAATSNASCEVSWGPVPDDQLNGRLRGFIVLYGLAENSTSTMMNLTTSATTFAAEITDLEIYTRYKIIVSGVTSKGPGNYFLWEGEICHTLEGGNRISNSKTYCFLVSTI